VRLGEDAEDTDTVPVDLVAEAVGDGLEGVLGRGILPNIGAGRKDGG